MAQRNNSSSFSTDGSRRSPPSRSDRFGKDTKQMKSRLHLMSATGFTQEHEMRACQRVFKFIRLPKFSEYFFSVDHHKIWRRHLAWSLRDGDHLRNAVTSRFASNMVFMSLLLGTEIGVLFSPSKPADTFREALESESYGDANFWAAIVLCCSIGLTLSTLVANFTAWAIIGAISPHNSHAILRSSVGLEAAQLPAKLAILSIYCFVVWVMLFIYILVPHYWGFLISIIPMVLIVYIVILYSSFGRLVIYSRAMQQKEIFKHQEDVNMSSERLFEELLKKAEQEKKRKSPLPLFYKSKSERSNRISELRSQEEEELVDMGFESTHASQHVRKILDLSESILPDEENNEQSNKYPWPPQNPNNHSEQQPNNGTVDTCGPLQSSCNSRAQVTYSVPRPGCPESGPSSRSC